MSRKISHSDRTPARPYVKEINPDTNALNLFVDSALNSVTVDYSPGSYFPAVVISVQESRDYNSEDIKQAATPYRLPGVNIKVRFSSSIFPVPSLPRDIPVNPASEGEHCFILGQYPEAYSEEENLLIPSVGTDIWVKPEFPQNPRSRFLWRSPIVEDAPAVKLFDQSAIKAFEKQEGPILLAGPATTIAIADLPTGQPHPSAVTNPRIDLDPSSQTSKQGLPGHKEIYGKFKSYIMAQKEFAPSAEQTKANAVVQSGYSGRHDGQGETLQSKTPLNFIKARWTYMGQQQATRAGRLGLQRGGGAQFGKSRAAGKQHMGTDVYIPPASIVYAPFRCRVLSGKRAMAYSNADGGHVMVLESLDKYKKGPGDMRSDISLPARRMKQTRIRCRIIHLKPDLTRNIEIAHKIGGKNGDGVYEEGEIIGVSYYSDKKRSCRQYGKLYSTKKCAEWIRTDRFGGGDPSHVHLETNIHGKVGFPTKKGAKRPYWYGDTNPYAVFDVSRLYQPKKGPHVIGTYNVLAETQSEGPAI